MGGSQTKYTSLILLLVGYVSCMLSGQTVKPTYLTVFPVERWIMMDSITDDSQINFGHYLSVIKADSIVRFVCPKEEHLDRLESITKHSERFVFEMQHYLLFPELISWKSIPHQIESYLSTDSFKEVASIESIRNELRKSSTSVAVWDVILTVNTPDFPIIMNTHNYTSNLTNNYKISEIIGISVGTVLGILFIIFLFIILIFNRCRKIKSENGYFVSYLKNNLAWQTMQAEESEEKYRQFSTRYFGERQFYYDHTGNRF